MSYRLQTLNHLSFGEPPDKLFLTQLTLFERQRVLQRPFSKGRIFSHYHLRKMKCSLAVPTGSKQILAHEKNIINITEFKS